jgi:hypothetical protein
MMICFHLNISQISCCATLGLPAGLFEALPAGLQWAVTELQQLQHSTAWNTCIRKIGMALITACGRCLALQEYGIQGEEMVQPAAQLAVLLLQAEQQATDQPPEAAGDTSSSSSSSTAGSSCPAGRDAPGSSSRWAATAAAQLQQQLRRQEQLQQLQLQPVDGVPDAVLEFLAAFGPAVYPWMSQDYYSLLWSTNDAVVELLLAYTALSVGAAHKKLAAADSGATTRSNRSSSSNGSSTTSSKQSGRRASTAASKVPDSHVRLLAAVSPPLHDQLSRRYIDNGTASRLGSFNSIGSIEKVEQIALIVLCGLMDVLFLRGYILKNAKPIPGTTIHLPGRARAATGSSSSSSSSPTSAASVRGKPVVPRERQLLLPLALTVIELLLLLPAPQHGVMRVGVHMLAHMVRTAQFTPAAAHDAAAGAAPAATACADSDIPYTEAAVFEALAGPVFLQLAPAVLQYLREVPAAPSSTAASVQAILQGSDFPGAADVEVVRGAFSIMVTSIISTGEVT